MRSVFLLSSVILAGGLSSCLYYPPQQGPPVQPGPQGQIFQQGQQGQPRFQQRRPSGNAGTTGGPVYQSGGQTTTSNPNVVIEGYQDPRVNPGLAPQDTAPQNNPTNEAVTETVAPPPPSNAEPAGGYPYATPVPGKSGMVYSPYAREKGWVDVSGIAPGTKVTDPHTQKIFLVP